MTASPAHSERHELIWRAACNPEARPIGVESLTGASIRRPRAPTERAHPALGRAEAPDLTTRATLAVSALTAWSPYTAKMSTSEG